MKYGSSWGKKLGQNIDGGRRSTLIQKNFLQQLKGNLI
jgi:hypothetical protein